ncbi:2'-5' RNA ligase family protein [Taibaiella lutea]|uniref:2'-5' RNA ligase family protein n=1 Tax=Taibaiella lutea TaxID=2608001 RepID=A0A5M6CE13_9BACT|nr:2'-5' RNA ligase family protein [Taibaiella lutea]KAA5532092.1 2'-5' RNA ligase family protein [Taibaiella lutea]
MELQTRNYPLIVTLELDKESKTYFNSMRKNYFPNHANYLDAHLTLFHHLPSNNHFIMDTLQGFIHKPCFRLTVSHLVNFEKGIAFNLHSEELKELHTAMQEAFDPFLKKHDKKPLWPHITIQNNVTAFKAQRTLEILQQDFQPFEVVATGISVWYYIGGPWRPNMFIPFRT